jgi:hypothetical protein
MCKSFRKDAVLFWNKDGSTLTYMNILRLIGVDEASAVECGGIALDLLRHNGVLVYSIEKSLWILSDNWEEKMVVLFGDMKTVDNINLIKDMIKKSPRNISLNIFEKALSRVILVPGDWHAGLVKLISINKIFYDGFLEVFQKLLGWKNIGKDARKCYYQNCRLVMLVNHMLTDVMFCEYYSANYPHLNASFDQSTTEPQQYNANIYAFLAKSFTSYLKSNLSSTDQWLCLCSNFLLMSRDLFDFIKAYRNSDSIILELYYERFAPICHVLGQHRYLERVWKQMEQLYLYINYFKLQVIGMNRTVRR